jgi:hypothetical protein
LQVARHPLIFIVYCIGLMLSSIIERIHFNVFCSLFKISSWCSIVLRAWFS